MDASASGLAAHRGSLASSAVFTSGSRSHYPITNGSTNRTANATQSLYTSILSPPPTKYARTIHNPSDPPQAASSRSAVASQSRRGSKPSDTRSARSIAECTRAQAKSRKEDKRKDKRSSKGAQKGRVPTLSAGRLGEDVDMKAVETLTSLLLQSRPSMTESASSPRSSISAGVEPSATHAYSHFAQSSTRTTTATATAVNSAEPSFTLPNHRSTTPPPHSLGAGPHSGDVTPKNTGAHRPHTPTDTEAADLMLYLATSPSPARPTTSRDKDAKDVAAFRALSGSTGLRATGRVLFPSAESGSDVGGSLAKSGENSFMLGMSNEIADGEPGGRMDTGEIANRASQDEPAVSSSKQSALTAQQLLPPPAIPATQPVSADSSCQTLIANPWPSSYSSSSDHKSGLQAPPTPNNVSFNFNDFINVSPSPTVPPRNVSASKSGLSSMRADIGRKLFEEEQQRHQVPAKTYGDMGLPAGKMQGFDDEFGDGATSRSLGAGIDLVQT